MSFATPANPLPVRPGTRAARVLLAITAVLVLYETAAQWKVDQDDAFIIYRYARNLAGGVGFVYNAGEHVLGVTSPLYTLVLAGLVFVLKPLGLANLPALSKIVGAAGLFASLAIGARILGDAGFRRAGARFPLAFLAVTPVASATGMETFLAMALALGALRFRQRDKFAPAAACAALAALARPDQGLLFLLLFAEDLWRRRRMPPRGALVSAGLILGGWALFSRFYFGSFLPNTLGAKLAQTASGRWGTGFIFLKGLTTLIRPPAWWLSGVSAILLVVDRIWRADRTVALLLAWQVLHLAAYGLVLNPPPYGWYYAPVGLGVALVISLGFDAALRRL
jgi:hypothetical protein